jgi:hypothetical protein
VHADEKMTGFLELESAIRAPNCCCGPNLLPRVHSILTNWRDFLQNLFKPRSESGSGSFYENESFTHWNMHLYLFWLSLCRLSAFSQSDFYAVPAQSTE